MAKTVLLPETTFTATDGDGVFTYYLEDVYVNENPITVVFDGVKYENVVRRDAADIEGFMYGAEWPGGEATPDFSNYPFRILSWEEGDIH